MVTVDTVDDHYHLQRERERATTPGVPPECGQMALVPGLNIGVGLFLIISVWCIAVLAILALAAIPKVRYV